MYKKYSVFQHLQLYDKAEKFIFTSLWDTFYLKTMYFPM